jgi:hypothetical protein
MKLRLPFILLPALLCATFQAAAEDISQGTILALDRKARVMVLTDRTVWPLETAKSEVPVGLIAGNRVEIRYESDEEGISAINEIRLLPVIIPGRSVSDVSEGVVLVYDRKARILVLTDRTSWPLESLKAEAPGALKAGDRVQIQYESDEEGISAINSIEIISN